MVRIPAGKYNKGYDVTVYTLDQNRFQHTYGKKNEMVTFTPQMLEFDDFLSSILTPEELYFIDRKYGVYQEKHNGK